MTDAPRSRRGVILRQVALGAAVTGAALLFGAAIPLGPLLRDDYVLDDVVRAVALDVRDFGLEKGTERLHFEIASRDLQDHVRPEDCTVEQGSAGVEVHCRWQVVFRLDRLQRAVPIQFSSHARVTAEGDLL